MIKRPAARKSTAPAPVKSRSAPARRAPAKLVIAGSEESADMLYATKFFVPDPFVLLVQDGRKTILLSDLEVDRGRREAAVDEVIGLSEFAKEHKKLLGRNPTLAKVAALFLKTRRVTRAVVPDSFPLATSLALAREGITVTPPRGGIFFPERIHKTPAELDCLRDALRVTAAGMARGLEVLAAAKPAGGKRAASHAELSWGNAPLTSERLRAEIDTAIVRLGGAPKDTIVAGGEQACDPHERGRGPLRAGELIILDLFPRMTATGYYGDMTRTVVKGRASDAQRKLWLTVQEGQRRAIAGVRAGADGQKLHEDIKKYFKTEGFPTETRDGRHVGFFHGMGHGLGLELHEQPRYNWTRSFQTGTVFTVEPGLYFPGTGGARLEDVVAVTPKGHEMLSNFEQRLEI